MKKLFIFLVLGIFFISLTSAVLDIKTFDRDVGNYGEIRINDLVFFNKIDYRLTEVQSSLIDVSAEGEYTAHKDSVLFNGLFLKDTKGSELDLKNAKYFYWVNESYEVEVPTEYKEVCNDNRTICGEEPTSFKTETRYKQYWKEYTLGSKVPQGEGKWRIEGERPLNKKVDFIIEAHGKTFDEWEWWDNSWLNKKAINLTTSTGSVTGYEATFNVSYEADMQTDFDDLRFINVAEDTELNYWIEAKVDSSWALVWVNVTDVINTTNQTVAYMYYNNPSASSESNASATFIFGDDFSTNTTANYNLTASAGTLASTLNWNSAGYITQSGTIAGNHVLIIPNGNLSYTEPSRLITRGMTSVTGSTSRFGVGVFDYQNVYNDIEAVIAGGDATPRFFYEEINGGAGTLQVGFGTVTANVNYTLQLVKQGGVYSRYVGYQSEAYSSNLTFTDNRSFASVNVPMITLFDRASDDVQLWDYFLVAKFHGGTFTSSFGEEEQLSGTVGVALTEPDVGEKSNTPNITFNATITPANVNLSNSSVYYWNTSLDDLDSDEDLVGWWKLDGTTEDSSAYGNNGTNFGADAVTGQYGGGYEFLDNNDRITISPTVFNILNGITFSAWVKRDSLIDSDTSDTVVTLFNTTSQDITLVFSTDLAQSTTGARITCGGCDDSLSSGTQTRPNANQWYHVAGTFDGTNMIAYLDGVAVTPSDNTAFTWNGNITDIRIGLLATNSGDFLGTIDDVRIYNRTLTETEIATLHNQTSQRYTVQIDNNETTQENYFVTDIPDGNWSWNVWAGGEDLITSDFRQAWGTTRYFEVDTQFPQINISAPNSTVNFPYLVNLNNITLNVTVTEASLDSCWYEYNGTNTTFSCSNGVLSENNLTINNQSDVTVWANDTFGNENSSTSDWTFTVFDFNNYTYDENVTESSSTTFIGNFQTGSAITEAFLQYNDTNESVSINSLGGNIYILSTTLTTPVVDTDTNITWFYWINGQNTTAFNQTVLNVNLDNCSSFGNVIVAYNLKDELTQEYINNSNSTIESLINLRTVEGQEVTEFNSTFEGVPYAEVCSEQDLTSSGLRLWEQSRYGSDDYVFEQHNIQNTSMTELTNITLLDLPSASATTFRIIYRSETFLPVPDAVIDVQRKYIGEGVFKSSEIPITDANGEASASLDLDAVIYRIIVRQNGTILSTFENPAVACQNILTGDCTITLNERQDISLINTFDEENDFDYGLTQNNRTITLTFDIPSGISRTVELTVNQSTILGNSTACEQSLFASSGQIQCEIEASLGDVFANIQVLVNDVIISNAQTQILEDRSQYFGTDNVVLTFFLTLSIVLLLISDPITVLIGIVLGLITSSLMLFLNSGSIFGVTSVVMYLVILIIILIVKISKRQQ